MPNLSKEHIDILPCTTKACEGEEVKICIGEKYEGRSIQWQVKKKGAGCWKDLQRDKDHTCLTIQATCQKKGYLYRAIIKIGCKVIVTNPTCLLILRIPKIIKQPQDQEVKCDEEVTFSVIADKCAKTYQWQVKPFGLPDWSDVGSDSPELTFIPEFTDNGNLYRVIVSNCCGSVTSDEALLTVNPVVLKLDDGTSEVTLGPTPGQQFLWLNRFTPATFPFTLHQIQVYFSSVGNVQVNDPIDLYFWENTTGSWNPAQGSLNFLGQLTGQAVNVLDAFSSYDLPVPLAFSGPGDILIGVVNRLPLSDPRYSSYRPAALDSATPKLRSWVGADYPSSIAPSPPVLQDVGTFWNVIDYGGKNFEGNWLIRGLGCESQNGKKNVVLSIDGDSKSMITSSAGISAKRCDV